VGTIAFPENGAEGTEENFTDAHRLSGHYKRSKFQAEQVALRYAGEGFPVVIVNPTAPVGEGDRKPTDTGKIILDFLQRKMPAYIDTGLNLVDVRDVAAGHLLALERGRVGERYILGGRNMSLHEILQALSSLTGLPAPRLRLPYAVAYCAGAVDTFLARFTGSPPRIPLEGVRMARYKMYVSSAKAARELGYQPAPVEPALERAIRWFRRNTLAVPE
jgi:dihydroflavonol-4-reductase